MQTNVIYKQDCLEGMKEIPDNSIDCVLTDPPYLYLKNQKLEREFDEQLFFAQCKRVLKKEGFIVLFGRGTSFYRWNTILAEIGFKFKEEIIWDKSYCSSPLMAISRVHETISIHSLGKGVIKKVKVPYMEMKKHDLPGIIADIKRLKTTFKNTKSLDVVIQYLENNNIERTERKNLSTTVSGAILGGDRSVAVMQAIQEGMNEKTIIKQPREHYNTIHPTQKPVKLLERLLGITSNPGEVILDPFAGSGSTLEACINTGRSFIGFEIDEEYHKSANNRVVKLLNNMSANMATLF